MIERLQTRAKIRRKAKGRKSVEEGKPDRIADVLEEAATGLIKAAEEVKVLKEDAFLYEQLLKLKSARIIKLQKERANNENKLFR